MADRRRLSPLRPLLIELGYRPSDIERELFSTWAGDEEAAQTEDSAAAVGQPSGDGAEESAAS